MASREIVLWLDERWYAALERHLRDESLQDKLEDYLDELCNQLPRQEYERISMEIYRERVEREAEREASRRFSVFRIRENGILYDVDYINGQKTGFFLDQKYNRAAAARLAPGMRVLDCFTHTGAFALNCAAAGAERVTAVDVSADALLQAEANARLNSLEDRIDFLHQHALHKGGPCSFSPAEGIWRLARAPAS